MRKHLLLLSAAILAIIPILAETPRLLPKNSVQKRLMNATEFKLDTPLKLAQDGKHSPMRASVEREQEILFEDFNNVPEGNTETIGNIGDRYCDLIAKKNGEPGRYIDPSYTPNSGAWIGNDVFAGKNGSIVLQTYNPTGEMASICTPLGDYSGDLTVTIRCRWLPAFYGADNDLGYVTSTGTELYLFPMIYGYDIAESADMDERTGFVSSGPIYEKDGWIELKFKYNNKSANNDGFIKLAVSASLEIDWIKIDDNATYLAPPAVNGLIDFNVDSFSVSWQDVRRSFNYYLDLWRHDYTADSGIDMTFDFEDNKLPEGWKAEENAVKEGTGFDYWDWSTGVTISRNGYDNALETSEFFMPLKTLSFFADFELANYTLYDPNTTGYAKLVIEGLSSDGWVPVTQVECDLVWTYPGFYMDYYVEGEEFEDRYTALRFHAENLLDGDVIYLDEIHVTSPRPYILTRVIGEDGMIVDPNYDDHAHNFYDYVRDLKYTFTGLDPEAEYYYRVRSHNMNEYGFGPKIHALGVAAPEMLPASNISETGYTANWKDVPKAQSYTVVNYLGEEIMEDKTDYLIFGEYFLKCKGTQSIDNLEYTYDWLDDYTDMPGWTGQNVYYGEGMLGGAYFESSVLTTPALPVNPGRGGYKVLVEFAGYPGDRIAVLFNKLNAYVLVPVESNSSEVIEIEVEDALIGETISFMSYNYMPFAIEALEILQDVKEGDIIATYLNESKVKAGAEKFEFTDLPSGKYFAYKVISNYNYEGKLVNSFDNGLTIVNIEQRDSYISSEVEELSGDIIEIARFNMQGIPVDENYKGIVLVKLSDGSVRKQVIK